MKMLVNSNAEIHKGTMVIDNDGNLKVNGSNLILSSGTIQRRAHPDSNVGFQLTPSGFITMGNLTINPDGLMTACNATVSNLTACNINGDLLTITSTNVFMNAPRITTQSSSLLFSSSNSTNNPNTLFRFRTGTDCRP
jgi:hypothetical protein